MTIVALVGSCTGSETHPPFAAPSLSATARDVSPSPNATASEAPASIDPIANPSIDGRFAVADDGREVALICWGDGSPTVHLETGGPNIEEWRNSGVVRELVGTEESEPELIWNNPGNTERLDVIGGFENRFANDPPNSDVPLLLITPVPGEASPEQESFWLQVSPESRQVELSCGEEPTEGPCATEVVEFVEGLD
jgi:hypothetical protein